MVNFSARAISWTWNCMVSLLSKVSVTTGPMVTRRSFLAAMTSARNPSRTRS